MLKVGYEDVGWIQWCAAMNVIKSLVSIKGREPWLLCSLELVGCNSLSLATHIVWLVILWCEVQDAACSSRGNVCAS
jgi:hypothetical protein